MEIGLKPVSDYWNSDKITWEDWKELDDWNFDDNKVTKLFKIFRLDDIRTGIIYDNDSLTRNNLFDYKMVWLNSNLLFWKNKITSEMDVYQRTRDSIIEILTIRYYFMDDNGNQDYFETSYSHFNINDAPGCGTPAVMEREEQRISGKPYFGNITKKQADSILTEWNKKTRHNNGYK